MFLNCTGVTYTFSEKIQEQFKFMKDNLFRQILALKIKILLTGEFYQVFRNPCFWYCNCRFLFKKNGNTVVIGKILPQSMLS